MSKETPSDFAQGARARLVDLNQILGELHEQQNDTLERIDEAMKEYQRLCIEIEEQEKS